jgi:hypothetical protein
MALTLAGCGAGWHQATLTPSGTFGPRQQVQVWSGHTSQQLHGVSWTDDSLFGRGYLVPLDCDSCARVALARSQVDSVRTGNPSAGFWRTTGLVLGGMVVVGVGVCAVTQDCALGE